MSKLDKLVEWVLFSETHKIIAFCVIFLIGSYFVEG